MKTYKLLKNLPLAKEGTIVKLEETPVKSTIRLMFALDNTEHPLCAIEEGEIGEWLEEIPETQKSVWELEEGDKFYFLGCDECIYDYWRDSNADRKIRDIGNCFLTQKEAEKELEIIKAIQKIKKYCWENGIKLADNEYIFNEDNTKFFIHYNINSKIFYIDSMYSYIPYYLFVFKNKYDAQKILDKFEEELKIIIK